jgi:Immunoglobulin-like domain of bacterial spore germination
VRRHHLVIGAALLIFAGCQSPGDSTPTVPAPVDLCATEDGALDDSAFVIATAPAAGSRVATGFPVRGCSRTFESTVVWRLLANDGSTVANGIATGGGVDGPAPFSFIVPYQIGERQIGHLEVFEEDVSDGEGFPPGRTVLPLVLLP